MCRFTIEKEVLIIETLHFDDMEAFACEISDMYDEILEYKNYPRITVVAKYDEAKQIIQELLCIGHQIANIDISDCACSGYSDSFVVTLTDDGIWCEKAFRDGRYISIDGDVVYLLDNCNSKIISYIEECPTYEVGIGDCCEDCDGCCDCEDGITTDKDTNFTTFHKIDTADDGYYSVTFSSTDADLVKEFAKLYM